MVTMNKDWHRVHPMPKNPTTRQQIVWHIDHAKFCACREIPIDIAEEMTKRGYEIPVRVTD
jgi:hypothetical protein